MESANAADQLSRIRQGLQAKALAGERGLLQVMQEQASELYALPHTFSLPNAPLTIVLLTLHELKQSLPTLICSFS